jgi:16S rRNA (cytidine1402-2'-O)-methyltransferase
MSATPAPLRAGTLYLVATPIGNLEDITLRAVRTLRECDIVAAEDTRRAGLLLQHLGVHKPLLSCFQFNEARRAGEIVECLRSGERVALITDAGSPGISDPGRRVVRAAIDQGFRVEVVPGPCALVAALSGSGLNADAFHFLGFLPVKSAARRRMLEAARSWPGTLVVYESPYRVEKLLDDLEAVFPERVVVVARELTKKFEEQLRGTPGELRMRGAGRVWRGEFVVLVQGAD